MWTANTTDLEAKAAVNTYTALNEENVEHLAGDASSEDFMMSERTIHGATQ